MEVQCRQFDGHQVGAGSGGENVVHAGAIPIEARALDYCRAARSLTFALPLQDRLGQFAQVCVTLRM
jgi:hypothetical protein